MVLKNIVLFTFHWQQTMTTIPPINNKMETEKGVVVVVVVGMIERRDGERRRRG